MDTDGGNVRRELPSFIDADNLAWSPDGTMLALSAHVANKEGVWVYEPASKRLFRVLPYRAWLSWSPDSKQLLVVNHAEHQQEEWERKVGTSFYPPAEYLEQHPIILDLEAVLK
jgi:hypothetical protein